MDTLDSLDGPVYIVGRQVRSVLWDHIHTERSATETPAPLFSASGCENGTYEVPLAHQLALAVLSGDTGAALLLADLVQEQHSGQASELQAEVRKRVAEAVMAERKACEEIVEVKQSVSALVDHTRSELAMRIRERSPGVRALRLASEAAELSASMPMITTPLNTSAPARR